MNHEYLTRLKKHPAWRLLNAETAPLIVSFLDEAFIRTNARSHSQSVLASKLDDHLARLKETAGEEKYPRRGQEYLDEWATGDNAYLRKYYPEKGDEPEFDLTPATEKAIEWLRSLQPKPLVGTGSRLMSIFQLLREVAQSTERDPAARLAVLERRKAETEAEIERVKAGRPAPHDPTLVRERYLEVGDGARRLLADFRQVEENFRQLDRRTREKIAVRGKSKGRLLDDIFGEEDAIASSDEGRSFRAFWEFLMSPARQQELHELVGKLLALEEVKALSPDGLLPGLKYRLMEVGEKVKKTWDSLADHLRRFLDEQAYLENRRIMELISSIEKRGMELKSSPPRDPSFFFLDDVRPLLDLTMARGLFDPDKDGKTLLLDAVAVEGTADFESEALYNIHFVDEEELRERLEGVLKDASQATLGQVCSRFPLEKGLSELLAYLNIASKDGRAVIEEEARETFSWRDKQGREKRADAPRVIFVQGRTHEPV